MSKVIQTLSAIAANKSGSPLLDAFQRENLIYYPIDATLEPEIKMLWKTRIKTTQGQLKKDFQLLRPMFRSMTKTMTTSFTSRTQLKTIVTT